VSRTVAYTRYPSWRRRRLPLAVVLATAVVLAIRMLTQGADVSAPPRMPAAPSATVPETVSGITFTMCARPHVFQNCVVDGDTFYVDRTPIRMEDIDAPETHPSRCDHEAKLGAEATQRLYQLVNAGPFQLERAGRDEHDRYGRKLRTAMRGGKSFGGIMVSEGLVRRWTGHRMPWCD
jgi:endonuclease YncB( thermonuclease family)